MSEEKLTKEEMLNFLDRLKDEVYYLHSEWPRPYPWLWRRYQAIRSLIENQPEEKSKGQIYDHEGREMGLFEVAEFFISKYPDDIFVSKPEEIVAIRENFKKILAKRKEANGE